MTRHTSAILCRRNPLTAPLSTVPHGMAFPQRPRQPTGRSQRVKDVIIKARTAASGATCRTEDGRLQSYLWPGRP